MLHDVLWSSNSDLTQSCLPHPFVHAASMTSGSCKQQGTRHLRSGVKGFYPFFEASFWKPAQEIHWTGNSNCVGSA